MFGFRRKGERWCLPRRVLGGVSIDGSRGFLRGLLVAEISRGEKEK